MPRRFLVFVRRDWRIEHTCLVLVTGYSSTNGTTHQRSADNPRLTTWMTERIIHYTPGQYGSGSWLLAAFSTIDDGWEPRFLGGRTHRPRLLALAVSTFAVAACNPFHREPDAPIKVGDDGRGEGEL